MKCKTCGRNVEKGWRFCPVCGSKVSRTAFVEFGMADLFAKIADTLTKKILEEFPVHNPMAPGKFSIKIVREKSMREFRTPNGEWRKEAINVNTGAQPRKVRPAPKETREPDRVSFNKMPGKLLVEVEIPGLNSLKDVDVRELGASVELRAYVGDILYFKIIKVPEKAVVVSKKILGNKVILEMRQQ